MSALLKSGVDGRALKIKTADLIERVGRLVAAAGFCRVSKTMLARYGSEGVADRDCFAPIDVVRDLERLVGDPIVTRFLAEEAGHVLIPRPRFEGVTVGDVQAAIGACAFEHGEAVSTTLSALADGRVTGGEARRIIKEIDDSIQTKLMLRALVEQAAEDDA